VPSREAKKTPADCLHRNSARGGSFRLRARPTSSSSFRPKGPPRELPPSFSSLSEPPLRCPPC
jgi:hypothetical protein